MSALSRALGDSLTMARRDLRHTLRYPVMTISGMSVPIFLLLLFSYIFGRALGAGLAGGPTGGTRYIDYLAPAIVLMTVGSGTAAIAINISADMTEGIVDRFRTMAIFRLPFTSSAFVPVDALPRGLRPFAEYQPFAVVIDT